METYSIQNEIYKDLIKQFDEELIKYSDKLVSDKKVNINKVIFDNNENFEIRGIVLENDIKHNTYIKVLEGEIENLSCTCNKYKEDYCACVHIIATVKEFLSNSDYKNIFNDKKTENIKIQEKEDNISNYTTFNQLIKLFKNMNNQEEEEKAIKEEEKKIRIEPKIIYNKLSNTLKLEIKIGEGHLYKVKSLPEFYERFLNKEKYKYGSKLEFVHTREAFEEESKSILDYVLKYAEIIKYANETTNGYEYYTKRLGEDAILISNSGIDELFEVLKNRNIIMEDENSANTVAFVPNEPEITFNLKKKNVSEMKIDTNIDIYEYKIFEGKEFSYILMGEKLYRCSKNFENTTIKMLSLFRRNFTKEIVFPKKQVATFFSLVEPYIKENINIEKEDYEDLKKYIPTELCAKMFLDYDSNQYIIADIRFVYDNVEINPLNIDKEENTIPRNAYKESKLLDMLLKTGFMYDQKNSRLILANEERIYNFLSEEIDTYIKNFEVMATESFKSKQIRKAEKISVGIRVENNLLDVDLSGFNIDTEELQELMKKYKLKKKYHRLKDGTFINLQENENIEFIENVTKDIDIDYSQIKDKKIKLPLYRSFYLEKILEKNSLVKLVRSEEYNKFIDGLDKNKLEEKITLPKSLKVDLREYQIVGYNWLKTLDEYGLGGILADDMGLGKTVQLLSVVCSYLENAEQRKPSLVVCPSSLTLNWQNEIEKFTNNVNSVVIQGKLEDRINQIENIPQYDIVITSYELLKRDLELYKAKNYEFKYIIADEAQYIKNNNTKNAKAIKFINAETKYALTGTPIENSLSELWSIFDFIMPGYLFTYKKFKELYETAIVKENDEFTTNKLRKLINPFVLRRVKSEVLTELPEKTITVLNSSMAEEQQEIYMSYLSNARKNVETEIAENGIEKSQIKILALLTRLRQICCHPSLFINNYEGESGKLTQCVEIIKDAIQSDHKILLFSGYTSMFDIIEEELKKENIEYYKLTGQTKVSERLKLVEDFNNNSNIKVFLISLKAGGTGLNLTGADMVIHYDPWWNLSAENQATDRTYRIGQKRNVQVYKLITKNSIEEKIYELQKRKEMLIDSMLSTNQTFISKLSREDILSLFE